MLHDWLKKFAPIFHPIRSKTKPNRDWHSHAFSRALRQLPVITSSFDWFTVLCVCSLWLAELLLWFWFYDTQLKTTLCKVNHSIPVISWGRCFKAARVCKMHTSLKSFWSFIPPKITSWKTKNHKLIIVLSQRLEVLQCNWGNSSEIKVTIDFRLNFVNWISIIWSFYGNFNFEIKNRGRHAPGSLSVWTIEKAG